MDLSSFTIFISDVLNAMHRLRAGDVVDNSHI